MQKETLQTKCEQVREFSAGKKRLGGEKQRGMFKNQAKESKTQISFSQNHGHVHNIHKDPYLFH